MSGHKDVYAGGAVARYLLIGSAVALTLFGLVMIYSASSITAAVREGSSWHFLLRQVVASIIGVAAAWALSRYDYRQLKGVSNIAWGVGIGALIAVFAVAEITNGSRRWIPLGVMNLQPSEVVKVICVLVVAAAAVDWMKGTVSTTQLMKRTAVIAGVPMVLIVLQPDLGTAVTLAAAVGLVLFMAGIEWKWIFASIGAVVVVAVLGILAEPYRVRRLTGFLDPFADPLGKGYQTVQALLAFGTGGVDGVGLGLSRQKFFYLPEAHTDFILAIIGEEAGLLGTLFVIVAFGVFLWAGVKIAAGSRDTYGRLVAGALTGMLGLQAILNMAAVTGLMPVTGKPLPFLSYGGSSLLVTMISVGLILSVSTYGALAPRAVRLKPRATGPTSSKRKEPRREGSDQRRGNGRPRLSRVDGGRAARRRA